MSRLARGLVHLGEVLLAAGSTELYPGLAGGPVVRSPEELVQWWDAAADLLGTPVAELEVAELPGFLAPVAPGHRGLARSYDLEGLAVLAYFGRVHGYTNLRVNDSSLLPDAPGVNPQAAIMAIAARNCAQFLSV